MNKQAFLENAAIGIACLVLVATGWFWALQVVDVIETLRLAYG